MYNQSPNILCKNFHLEAKIPHFGYICAYLSHILQLLITSTMLNYEELIVRKRFNISKN